MCHRRKPRAGPLAFPLRSAFVATGTPATALLAQAGVAHTLHPYEHDPRAETYGAEAAVLLGVIPARLFKTLIAAVDGKLTLSLIHI